MKGVVNVLGLPAAIHQRDKNDQVATKLAASCSRRHLNPSSKLCMSDWQIMERPTILCILLETVDILKIGTTAGIKASNPSPFNYIGSYCLLTYTPSTRGLGLQDSNNISHGALGPSPGNFYQIKQLQKTADQDLEG